MVVFVFFGAVVCLKQLPEPKQCAKDWYLSDYIYSVDAYSPFFKLLLHAQSSSSFRRDFAR
jgi:hypothetical protein